MNIDVTYTHDYLRWLLGAGHPTDPARALRAVTELTGLAPVNVIEPRAGTRAELELVHDPAYVSRVLDAGRSGEWTGERRDLGEVARVMFGGTMTLVDELLRVREAGAERWLGFNPAGAKHHAMRDRSGGFCVFNDAAAAAVRLAEAGLSVAYVDWDAHHGDGVEALLMDEPDILTVSIHDGTIFPGTGHEDTPSRGAYNWPMEAGSGDYDLDLALAWAGDLVRAWEPDVLLVAMGADGLANDPLTSLTYTHEGLVKAAQEVAGWAPYLLVGGAGGYLAQDETPHAWAESMAAMHQAMSLEA